jgi:hypothetical protein
MIRMDEMIINNKAYIPREEYDKLKEEKTKEYDENKIIKDLTLDITAMDEARIMGLGTAKLSEKYRAVQVDIIMLKKAINIMEQLSINKKRESLVLAIAEDLPLGVGAIRDGNKFSGVIIAPRIPKTEED